MNVTPLIACVFGFVSVMVKVEALPVTIEDGENVMVTLIETSGVTVSVALAGAAFGGALDVTAPAAMLLA